MDVEAAYAFLGVPPNERGSLEKLKARFRKLCLAYHPDKNLGREKEAAAAFTGLHAAYHFLTTNNFDHERWATSFVIPPLQSLEEVLMLALRGAEPGRLEELLRRRGEYRPHAEFGINLSIPWTAGTQEDPSYDVAAGSAHSDTRPLGSAPPMALPAARGDLAADGSGSGGGEVGGSASEGGGGGGGGGDGGRTGVAAATGGEEEGGGHDAFAPGPVTRGPQGLQMAVVEAPQLRALGLHAAGDAALLAHYGGQRAELGGDPDRRPWEEAALRVGPPLKPARPARYVPPPRRPELHSHSAEAAQVADEYNTQAMRAFKAQAWQLCYDCPNPNPSPSPNPNPSPSPSPNPNQAWQLCYDCASEAIRLQPLKVAYYGNRAASALKLRGLPQLKQAVADSLRACELDPSYARGHARAAEAYLCLGEKATVLAAIDEYEKAMKLAPDNRAYREAHGRACIIYESDYAQM